MGVIIKAVGTSYGSTSPSIVVHAGKAVKEALTLANIRPEQVGVLINTCVYRDSNMIEPAIAALIQKESGIGLEYEEHDKTTISFDLMNGACGVLNAIQVANSLLQTASTEHVMIVSGDTHPNESITDATDNFPYATSSGAFLLSVDENVHGFGKIYTSLDDGPLVAEGYLDMSSMGTNGRNQITLTHESDWEEKLLEAAATVATAALNEAELDLSTVLLIASTPTPTFPLNLGKRLGISNCLPSENRGNTAGIFHTAAIPLGYFHASADKMLEKYSNILFVTAGAGPSAAATIYRLPAPVSQ